MKNKPKSIVIIGRRWFQRTYGNTYCSSEIIVDGKHVKKMDETYGYESYYEQMSIEWLVKNGYLDADGDRPKPLWKYRDEGIEINSYVSDVRREKDL